MPITHHRSPLLRALTVTLLLLFAFSACAGSAQLHVFDEPIAGCQLPCWQAITPGVTSATTAVELIENSAWEDDGVLREFVSGFADTAYAFRWEPAGVGQLHNKNGRVFALTLFQAGLQVADVVDVLSTPDLIIGRPESDAGYVVYLLYLDKGLAVTSFSTEPRPLLNPLEVGAAQLQADFTISQLQLMAIPLDTGSAVDMAVWLGMTESCAARLLAHAETSWHGYGAYPYVNQDC